MEWKAWSNMFYAEKIIFATRENKQLEIKTPAIVSFLFSTTLQNLSGPGEEGNLLTIK